MCPNDDILLYKPDWDEARERFKAWWAHEYCGRCLLSVKAPKADLPPNAEGAPTAAPPPALPARVEDRWLDHDYIAAANEYRMQRTWYGGEAFPIWSGGYPGWAGLPTYLGAPVHLDETTGWTDPILTAEKLTDYDYHKFAIDRTNHWWMKAERMTRFSAEQARGKSFATIGALGGVGDTLAALRGNAALLFDLIDCPDYVREFDAHLVRLWMELYDFNYAIVGDRGQGSTTWMELWSPGKFYPLHNDFAYMISPKMFREIFLPNVEAQTQFLDHACYHVDGIGNFNHVDALLELPRLQAYQILPGAGKPSPLHFMDILKRVQAAGKNLHLTIPPEEVKPALENLSARGLYLETWTDTEEEGRALLRNCEKWSRD